MTTNEYNYNVSEVNREFLMKVFGWHDGVKVNTLVGVDGLIRFFGIEFANKFTARAMECMGDSCTCKLRRGIKVTFYRH